MVEAEGMSKADMGEAMANMTGMDVEKMDQLGMADMAMGSGLTRNGSEYGSSWYGRYGCYIVMTTNVAGLGSKAVQGVADLAKVGTYLQVRWVT